MKSTFTEGESVPSPLPPETISSALKGALGSIGPPAVATVGRIRRVRRRVDAAKQVRSRAAITTEWVPEQKLVGLSPVDFWETGEPTEQRAAADCQLGFDDHLESMYLPFLFGDPRRPHLGESRYLTDVRAGCEGLMARGARLTPQPTPQPIPKKHLTKPPGEFSGPRPIQRIRTSPRITGGR